MSKKAIGFDGLINFYTDRDKICDLEFEAAFKKHLDWNTNLASPYTVEASEKLVKLLEGENITKGITISAPGFYGPQGRQLRIPSFDININDKIENFIFEGQKVTNYEMESSAIFGLSKHLGHNAITLCAIIANRTSKEYSKDYKPIIKNLIKTVLDKITN
jgi:uridine phosphorylase